jgi:hypothetical protein
MDSRWPKRERKTEEEKVDDEKGKCKMYHSLFAAFQCSLSSTLSIFPMSPARAPAQGEKHVV